MIQIFIPSLSRAHNIFKPSRTLGQIPKDLYGQCNLIVYPDQVEEYKKSAKKHGYFGVGKILVYEGPRGIAYKRKFIGEYAYQQGIDKFVFVDDDLKFYVRKKPGDYHTIYAKKEDIIQMFDLIERTLDKVPVVGISSRERNYNIISHAELNTRIMRVCAFQTKIYNECELARVSYGQDLDVLLQLLRKGYMNLCIYWYAQGQPSTQDAGGCSETRTNKSHEESMKKLKELHPDFVRFRQKSTKSGGVFGKRLEVRISWKKAYASSQKHYDR